MSHLSDTPVDAYAIVFLDPAACTFEREPGGARLRMVHAAVCCYLDIRAARSLPLSRPAEYIALRDSKDAEIGIFRTLDGMDETSRALLLGYLDRAYLLPMVTKVISVKEQGGLVLWDVETDHGRRKFVARSLREDSVALTGKRVLVSDVDGNRYDFRDIYALGRAAGDILQKVL